MVSERLPSGILLTCLAIVVAACRATSPAPQPLPTGREAATAVSSAAALRTPEGTLLREMQADLDGNGGPEFVAATEVSGEVVISIVGPDESGKPWQATLPSGVEFSDLRTQDLTADNAMEVLVEYRIPQEHSLGLAIVQWGADEGRLLSPQGGPLSGAKFFESQYYAPWIEDLNGDNCPEIIVSLDGSNANYLDQAVYEWGRQGYMATEFYIVPPRLRPTPSAQ